MLQILSSISNWLHAIATVIFVGHYLLLSVIYLPAAAQGKPEVWGPILSEISKRSRVWLYVSLLIFTFTGIYMTAVDPNYLGFANFGNVWGVLMLLKHVLIVGIVALGFWFNAILRVGPLMSSNSGGPAAILRFRLYCNLMAIAGMLVLLLTAFAQGQ